MPTNSKAAKTSNKQEDSKYARMLVRVADTQLSTFEASLIHLQGQAVQETWTTELSL
jgi:hypothetical protein